MSEYCKNISRAEALAAAKAALQSKRNSLPLYGIQELISSLHQIVNKH